jgi:hypothetical protein
MCAPAGGRCELRSQAARTPSTTYCKARAEINGFPGYSIIGPEDATIGRTSDGGASSVGSSLEADPRVMAADQFQAQGDRTDPGPDRQPQQQDP